MDGTRRDFLKAIGGAAAGLAGLAGVRLPAGTRSQRHELRPPDWCAEDFAGTGAGWTETYYLPAWARINRKKLVSAVGRTNGDRFRGWPPGLVRLLSVAGEDLAVRSGWKLTFAFMCPPASALRAYQRFCPRTCFADVVPIAAWWHSWELLPCRPLGGTSCRRPGGGPRGGHRAS